MESNNVVLKSKMKNNIALQKDVFSSQKTATTCDMETSNIITRTQNSNNSLDINMVHVDDENIKGGQIMID